MQALPLQITPRASDKIRHIMEAKNIAPGEYGLRVGLKGSGCGATFLLGFDKPANSDTPYQGEGFTVYIDRKHLMYVIGLEIDYEEGALGQGFTFSKPD
jgi:iron-sulfur cluster assembly protein